MLLNWFKPAPIAPVSDPPLLTYVVCVAPDHELVHVTAHVVETQAKQLQFYTDGELTAAFEHWQWMRKDDPGTLSE